MHKPHLHGVIKALKDAQRSAILTSIFTMSKWGYEGKEANHCGTPACVMGHYAARHDIQKKFHLNRSGEVVFRNGRNIDNDPRGCMNVLADYFEISRSQANDIFGSEGCQMADTPRKAAKYIRNFIKTGRTLND